ncbi:MPC [Symbiodinium natans]|uniref:MPC protein n=1 Tax=Symbiodinium natans TaxID=878477 RepID=A0A812R489_9DINO|nr:MPC [Symbiodinium natans]
MSSQFLEPGLLSIKSRVWNSTDVNATQSCSFSVGSAEVESERVPDQALPLTPDPTPLEEEQRLDEVFGGKRQLDRFRASFVFAEFDSTYGPVGLSPLERERRLEVGDFLRLMAAGATASLIRALLFLPIQNVKVRMQTNPDLGGGDLGAAVKEIAATQPAVSFYKAVDVVAIYAVVFGFFSFGVKEFLSRELVIQFPGLNELLAIIAASVASVFITMLAGAPWEVLTTQVMAGKEGPQGRFFGLSLLWEKVQANPWKAAVELYEEYWLLSGKELAFVVTKFLVFDSLRETILFVVPAFAEAQSLVVACGCGAVAGALGAITSHPIDTLFALRTTGGAGDEIPSLDKLFRGVGARVLIYSPGIALTFLVSSGCM